MPPDEATAVLAPRAERSPPGEACCRASSAEETSEPSASSLTAGLSGRRGAQVEGLAELAFRRHHGQIYRYLRRRTHDSDRAEDLAQEVFADAAAALSPGEWRPVSMLGWLYTIAQRRFADDVRRRRHVSAGVPLDDVVDQLAGRDSSPEVGRALRDGIAALAPDQRRVIAMKLLRGCSFDDIAGALEVSEAAAKMRFQRALAALRTDLERQGIAH
jgi:RNA polymerase sigma factor (sigma-70 family)